MKRFRPLDYAALSVYWFALTLASNSLHPIILPVMVQGLVPQALKATYLGFLTFAGLVVAIVVQPVMGALSDRSTVRWGRRRPFILAGTLLDLLFLALIALAGHYWLLLAGVLLLQFASNTAHGAYQGLIPDLVPQEKRGTASGAKGLAELGGVIVAAPVAGYLMDQGEQGLAIGFVMAVLFVAMLITVLIVQEDQPQDEAPARPLPATIFDTFRFDFRKYPDFMWWLPNRFLFFVGLSSIQTFGLYFIEDVIKVSSPARATGNLMATLGLAILFIIYPAGCLADRIGRKPLLIFSGLGAASGMLLLLLARSYQDVMIYGGLLGLSAGIFISASWALATDLVPPWEAGRYLGLSNLATAGGSAAARLGGPLIDLFNARQAGLGYSVLLMVSGLCFLLGTVAILKVREIKN